MSKVLWLSDFDMEGSGYLNISASLCTGLTQLGHEVKAIGLRYDGREHWFNFSIIPVQQLEDSLMMANNLHYLWEPDVFVVALDMPLQYHVMDILEKNGVNMKHIGIMPLEAPPLRMTWAMMLMKMKKVFIISQFGTDACQDKGIPAEHLVVGVDTKLWRVPEQKEKDMLRESLGIGKDTFVIMTNADNQERKNLSKAMEAMSILKSKHGVEDFMYVMVTRPYLPVGWGLDDLALDYKIQNNIMIFNRGLSSEELWRLYAISDAFLLPSKAEGLGMPVLEAMSMKIPVVGTDCTAISEHLEEDRGWAAEVEYSDYIDPFGNQYRYFVSAESIAEALVDIRNGNNPEFVENAYNYIQDREWKNSVLQVHKAIKEVTNA